MNKLYRTRNERNDSIRKTLGSRVGREKLIFGKMTRRKICIGCRGVYHRHGYIGFTKVGNDICSGIPVGNSRRLRDYSRHPLREYIITWRVYVSSYDRHFRFRRALLTSFRFWPRINVFTSRCRLSFRVLPSRGERIAFSSPLVVDEIFQFSHFFRNSFESSLTTQLSGVSQTSQRSAINHQRDASQLLIRK